MKNLLLVFILALIYNTDMNAQIGFQENTVFNPDSYISFYDAIAKADLDNDGDIDIIVIEVDDFRLAWYENLDGEGNFAPYRIISENTEERVLGIGDVNNDGFVDIVLETNWFKNIEGTGTFEEQDSFGSHEVTGLLQQINLADIDGDGDLDILLNKYWYENIDGQGQFTLKQQFYTGSNNFVYSYHGDLDGDGDLDIAVEADRLYWVENLDGLGTFGELTFIASVDDSNRFLSIANLDADSNLEIVTASLRKGPIIHKQIDGAWVSNPVIEDYVFQYNFKSLDITDIDGDGDIDIWAIFENSVTDSRWYQNIGGGNFREKNLYIKAFQAVSANIDGDNDKDFITVNECSKLEWIEFPNLTKHHISESLRNFSKVLFADIDSDSDLDVITVSQHCPEANLGNVVWFENVDGYVDYNDVEAVRPIAKIGGANFDKILVEDFDMDGNKDVFLLGNNRLYILKNNNSGENFTNHKVIVLPNVGINSRIFDLADMDQDGDVDVIAYNAGTVWYENINGNFDTLHQVSNVVHKSLQGCDIDSDGDMDIVFGNFNLIGWYENLDGSGNFSSPQQIGEISIDKDYTICTDIDGDLDLDIVSFNDTDNSLLLFSNDGSASFNSQTIGTGVFNLRKIITVDIDNDSDIDVVCSTSSSNLNNSSEMVYWFENLDSNSNFGPKQSISTKSSIDIDSGDFDRDGDADLVSCFFEDIFIFKNLLHVNNKIHGSIFYDTNANDCSSGSIPLANQILITADNGADKFSTFSQQNGSYQLLTNDGDFTVNISSPLENFLSVNPSSYNYVLNGLDNIFEADFCISPLSAINDLNIAIYPITDSRPGFDTSFSLVYSNSGSTILSGSIEFLYDGNKLDYMSSSHTPDSITDDSLNFNFTDLFPFETRTIEITLRLDVPPTNQMGDILEFSGQINPLSGDINPDDNLFILKETVVNSFDPNDIIVLEGDQIPIEAKDDYLHYIIRFQNIGTASAINVSISNIIDPLLDWKSLQIQASSHPMYTQLDNGSDLSFYFNNINLPGNIADEENSHGYIAYKIKPNDNIDIGDIIPNKADIFFDFNAPIETNLVTTEVVSTLGIDNIIIQKIIVYPNPATEALNINSNTQITQLEIYDYIGQVVLSVFNKNTVDISSLSSGFYLIKVKDELGNSEIKKFIKK